MSNSLENILKDTYDKDKLDLWFKTNETKLLNDLNNCKNNYMACSGTQEFSTLRNYFKEFKDDNNNDLDDKTH